MHLTRNSSHPAITLARGRVTAQFLAVFVSAAWIVAPLRAQFLVDGRLGPGEPYGSARGLQDTATGFGDNSDPGQLSANGSELDGAYAVVSGGTLNLLLTGNLETDFTRLEIFIDSLPGGQNVLGAANPDVDSNGLNAMAGLSFDDGFTADYYFTLGGGGVPGSVKFGVHWAEVKVGGAGTFLGSTVPGSTAFPVTLGGGASLGISNTNLAGVTATAVGDPAAVTTGFEFSIPLALIGNPTGPLAVCVFLNSDLHDFVSNQSLPGMAGASNGGVPAQVKFGAIPGDQFFTVPSGTTIDPTERFAWGENIGWTNWRWDTGTPGAGAAIGQYFCTGLIYGENVGWIKLGTGAPANGFHYGNTDGSDFGVNHDGAGGLSGLAWGENIGWIKFEQARGKPRIDLSTGKLAGHAWSENCGWINLGGHGTHVLTTERIDAGPDSDGDMIADAWEREQAMLAGLAPVLTHLDKTTDRDGDRKSDFDEYLADSDPFNADDSLRIVHLAVRDELVDNIDLKWTSSPRRLYDIESSENLDFFMLEFANVSPAPGTTTGLTFTAAPLPRNFWKVGAKLPLAP